MLQGYVDVIRQRGSNKLWHQEERKLRIELARLQMKQRAKLIVFIGLLLLEFLIFGALYVIISTTLNPWLLVVAAGLVAVILLTIFNYMIELKQIENETQKLIKKFSF